MWFPNYELGETSLGKGLKMLVSEERFTCNILNGLKHCQNLHSSTFNIFADQY